MNHGRLAGAAMIALVLLTQAACSGGPLLAQPPVARPSPPPEASLPAPVADPVPIELPRDDAPHRRLTEWWYYTGHLEAASGSWYGFEYVVFRAERGSFPVAWASHLAITDETGRRFVYAQRSEIGPQVDRSPASADGGFSFELTGYDATRPETAARPPWAMAGASGTDELAASLGADEASVSGDVGAGTLPGAGPSAGLTPGAGRSASPTPGGGTTGAAFGIDLRLVSTRPAALHDTDGWIDFGPAGGSYYYSRTRMTATGSLVLDGQPLAVHGTAWFDHQWGDFIAVGGGGWDWFALGLDDGTDLTISLVRDRDGSYPLVYGTLVAADGSTRHLPAEAVSVEATGSWTSPRTGATYPSGWRVRVPSAGLDLTVVPTVRDQELDTRATTGVVYWEGSQLVAGSRDGREVTGRGYVELTGYTAATDP